MHYLIIFWLQFQSCLSLLKTPLFYFGNIFDNFHSNFTIFERIIAHSYYLQVVLADVGNQLKVRPNATEPDDASMQQCAVAHCAAGTQDGSNVDFWDIKINWSEPISNHLEDDISNICCNRLSYYFIYLHEPVLKLRFSKITILNLLCIQPRTWPKLWSRFYKVVQLQKKRARWVNYTLSCCKFLVVYVCQKLELEKVALDGSVECYAPPPRRCDLELWPFDPKT